MSRLAAVILAAGLSSRMGRFKPLLPLGRGTVLSCCVELFTGAGGGARVAPVVDDVLVVTGNRAEDVAAQARSLGARPVHNPDYEQGMYSSVLAGVSALPSDVDGFFLLPVDLPLVRPVTVRALRDAFLRQRPSVLYPVFRGERGHPPVISSSLVPDILRHDGSGGLRRLLERFDSTESGAAPACELAVADYGTVHDLDHPHEYARALELAGLGSHGGQVSHAGTGDLVAHAAQTAWTAEGTWGERDFSTGQDSVDVQDSLNEQGGPTARTVGGGTGRPEKARGVARDRGPEGGQRCSGVASPGGVSPGGAEPDEIGPDGAALDEDPDVHRSFSSTCPRPYPCDAECEAMWELYGLPERVRLHSLAVGHVAEALCERLNRTGRGAALGGTALDCVLVRSAGRMHDVGKGTKRHEAAGAERLREHGFDAAAVIAAEHFDMEISPDDPVTESVLVFLADKLVRGVTAVPLERRFGAKLDQYGHIPEAREAILGRLGRARGVLERVNSEMGASAEDIAMAVLCEEQGAVSGSAGDMLGDPKSMLGRAGDKADGSGGIPDGSADGDEVQCGPGTSDTCASSEAELRRKGAARGAACSASSSENVGTDTEISE